MCSWNDGCPKWLTFFAQRIRSKHNTWLKAAHDRVGSSTDPNLNGHLKYPNNFDQSLNDAAADKVRKYRADYNNRPPSGVSFMPAIASTSARLHSEFVRLLFLQANRETDRFFTASGVLSAQSDRGFYHFVRATVSSQLKSKVGLLRWSPRGSNWNFLNGCRCNERLNAET